MYRVSQNTIEPRTSSVLVLEGQEEPIQNDHQLCNDPRTVVTSPIPRSSAYASPPFLKLRPKCEYLEHSKTTPGVSPDFPADHKILPLLPDLERIDGDRRNRERASRRPFAESRPIMYLPEVALFESPEVALQSHHPNNQMPSPRKVRTRVPLSSLFRPIERI